MATSRITLRLSEDSMLHQQFDRAWWIEQDSASACIEEGWNPDMYKRGKKSAKVISDKL